MNAQNQVNFQDWKIQKLRDEILRQREKEENEKQYLALVRIIDKQRKLLSDYNAKIAEVKLKTVKKREKELKEEINQYEEKELKKLRKVQKIAQLKSKSLCININPRSRN